MPPAAIERIRRRLASTDDGNRQMIDILNAVLTDGLSAATAVKRQHERQRIAGNLLSAEINKKQAWSIQYQFNIAGPQLARDPDDFQLGNTPINQTLVNDLAYDGLIALQRNAVLVDGRPRQSSQNKIRSGCPGRLAEHLIRMDFIMPDELRYRMTARLRHLQRRMSMHSIA